MFWRNLILSILQIQQACLHLLVKFHDDLSIFTEVNLLLIICHMMNIPKIWYWSIYWFKSCDLKKISITAGKFLFWGEITLFRSTVAPKLAFLWGDYRKGFSPRCISWAQLNDWTWLGTCKSRSWPLARLTLTQSYSPPALHSCIRMHGRLYIHLYRNIIHCLWWFMPKFSTSNFYHIIHYVFFFRFCSAQFTKTGY